MKLEARRESSPNVFLRDVVTSLLHAVFDPLQCDIDRRYPQVTYANEKAFLPRGFEHRGIGATTESGFEGETFPLTGELAPTPEQKASSKAPEQDCFVR